MGFSETMKALADPVRRDVLVLLRGGERTAGEIAERSGMTAAAMSYHLAQLKKAGLVYERKKGNYIYYGLNTSVLEELMLWLRDLRGGGEPGEGEKK